MNTEQNAVVDVVVIQEKLLIAKGQELIENVTLEENAKVTRRNNIIAFLILCAETNTSREEAKAIFTSHASWEALRKSDGTPANEIEARKGYAGKAWNSLNSNGYSKYVCNKDGVPVTYVDPQSGEVSLVKAVKTPSTPDNTPSQETVAEVNTAHAEVIAEQDLSVHWQAVLGKLTQKQFDEIRADLEALGCNLTK